MSDADTVNHWMQRLLEQKSLTVAVLECLKAQVDAHYATWMAARADVEGAELSATLFEMEPEVIEARKLIASGT